MRLSGAILAGLIAFTLAGCFEGKKGDRGEQGTPARPANGASAACGPAGPAGARPRSVGLRSDRCCRPRGSSGPAGSLRSSRLGRSEQRPRRSGRKLHRRLQQFVRRRRSRGVGDVRELRPGDRRDDCRRSGRRGLADFLPGRLRAPRRGLYEALGSGYGSSTTRPSRIATRRSMRAASSMLWVASTTVRPDARINCDSAWNT